MFNDTKAVSNYFWLSKILNKTLLVHIIPHKYDLKIMYLNIVIGDITQENKPYQQIYKVRLFSRVYKVTLDVMDIVPFENAFDTFEFLAKRRISDLLWAFRVWVSW